jgi:hypothetical protein
VLFLGERLCVVGENGVVESLTLDDWRPARFLVVAQLDVTVEALRALSLTVEIDDVHGEHAAVLRLPTGLVFCLVATPPYVPGFALRCGDPETMDWGEALDVFLAGTPFERPALAWVPQEVSEPSGCPSDQGCGFSWEDGTGLLGVDDPVLVDAAFERGEPHVGVAVIGLALNHGDPAVILPRVSRTLEAPSPELRRQGTIALAHVARLHRTVDQRCLTLLRARPRGNEADDDLWSFVPHRRLPWWLWRHRLPNMARYWLWERWRY